MPGCKLKTTIKLVFHENPRVAGVRVTAPFHWHGGTIIIEDGAAHYHVNAPVLVSVNEYYHGTPDLGVELVFRGFCHDLKRDRWLPCEVTVTSRPKDAND